MATANEDGRFQVKVPDPSKRYNKAGTQWVRARVFDLKGRSGSRTGRVHFRNVWYSVQEHESIVGSFIAGKTCAASKDAEAPGERKLRSVTGTKKAAKKKTASKKAPAKRTRKAAKTATSSKRGSGKRAAAGSR